MIHRRLRVDWIFFWNLVANIPNIVIQQTLKIQKQIYKAYPQYCQLKNMQKAIFVNNFHHLDCLLDFVNFEYEYLAMLLIEKQHIFPPWS